MPHSKAARSIFITGAGSGIGRATAQLFAERGWFVGAVDVEAAGLSTLADMLGHDACLTNTLDVTDRTAYAAAMSAFIERTGGRLDLLFNNAGVISSAPIDDQPWEVVERVLKVNLFGPMIGVQVALPWLKATSGSLCLTTCSASAVFGSANLVAYSATKQAVKGMTEALSIELHKHGVRAADVLPGIVETAMLPPEQKAVLPPDGPWRLIQPRDVAEVVWRAYTEDRIHWYVPEELHALHVQAVQAPEQARDMFLALGRG